MRHNSRVTLMLRQFRSVPSHSKSDIVFIRRKYTTAYDWSKMHHKQLESYFGAIPIKYLQASSVLDKLDLSSFYIKENVWLFGSSIKFNLHIFREGPIWQFISDSLWCKIVLDWYLWSILANDPIRIKQVLKTCMETKMFP